jgi:hypothetical protein
MIFNDIILSLLHHVELAISTVSHIPFYFHPSEHIGTYSPASFAARSRPSE